MIHKNGDIDVYYETHGATSDTTRPWIVFSHSLACTSAMWEPQFAEFAKRYRVLAFDTRGHGQSSAPKAGADGANYTFDELVSDAESLFTALKIEQPHFVGLSMGGMLGQALALKHPNRLRSLVIADSVCEWPAGTADVFAGRVVQARKDGMKSVVEATLGRWFTPPYHKSNPTQLAEIARQIAETPIEGYAGCSYSIPRVNFTAQLKTIKAPILVLVGKDDPATTVTLAQQIHKAAPGSVLSVIPNAAHLSNVEQAAAFNADVQNFLDRNFQ
ncbi:MAG TPA: alpha/beta fold hydrolase [Xanthobacteraceae bacterium]|jgi:3-oxoadipate enol-lactonase|nr:alpha/beta fold hydrolase [Xanthobacteraceae bacterium]